MLLLMGIHARDRSTDTIEQPEPRSCPECHTEWFVAPRSGDCRVCGTALEAAHAHDTRVLALR